MYKSNIMYLSDNDLVHLCRSSNFNDKIIYCGMSGRFLEIFTILHQNKCRVFDSRNVRLTTAKQLEMYEVIGRWIEKLIVTHGSTGEPNNMDVILQKCPNLKIMVWVKLNGHATSNGLHFSGQKFHKLNRLQELHLVLGVVKMDYFTKICSNVRELRRIHIDVIYGVSNEALLQLAEKSTNLAEVFIRLTNDLVDAEHLTKLRALKKLHLVTTELYTEPLTTLLVGLVENHGNRLEFLAIETTIFPHEDIPIVANLRKLKQLLIHCEKFANENMPGIDDLCHLAIMPNLEAAYLHNIRYKIYNLELLQLMRAVRNVNMLCVTPTADEFTIEFYGNVKQILMSQIHVDAKKSLTLGSDRGPLTAEEKAIVDEEFLKIVPSYEVRWRILGNETYSA